jgi:hypothetical protein
MRLPSSLRNRPGGKLERAKKLQQLKRISHHQFGEIVSEL